MTRAAALLLLAAATASAAPLARDLSFVVDAEHSHVLRLQPRWRIPDGPGGVLNLPATPAETLAGDAVSTVAITLHDLAHPSLNDVEAVLLHGDASILLFNGASIRKPLAAGQTGATLPPSLAALAAAAGDADAVAPGAGVTVQLQELQGANIALHRRAQQSSTGFGGAAERAVDGNTDGRFHAGSVSHTGGDGGGSAAVPRQAPWWQVHLDGDVPVSFIRLFNRAADGSAPEVQELRSHLVGPLHSTAPGSFRITASYAGRSGTTAPIAANAVGGRAEETGTRGSGAGVGESVGAALEALTLLGDVSVSAQPVPSHGTTHYGARRWRVTFHGSLGDVPQLTVSHVAIQAQGGAGAVTVSTLREGSATGEPSSAGRGAATSGRLFPASVMVLSAAAAAALPRDAALADVKAAAAWWVDVPAEAPGPSSLAASSWAAGRLLPLPAGVVGGVVRVQLADADYLALAEVQVFSTPENVLSFHSGGGGLHPDASLRAEGPLSQRLAGAPASGSWTLSIRDFALQRLSRPHLAEREGLHAGTGSIGLWSAAVTLASGRLLRLHPAVTVRIVSLPVHGTLHEAALSAFDLPRNASIAASTGVVGPAIAPDAGRGPHLALCPPGAACQTGSSPPFLSTHRSGGTTAPGQRLTLAQQALSVVYVPPSPGWAGVDSFTYVAMVGGVPSPPATVTVHVAPCRTPACAVERGEVLPPHQAAVWDALHGATAPLPGTRLQWLVRSGA